MSYLLVVAGSLAAEADVAPRADWGGAGAGGVKEEDCNDDTTPAKTWAMVAGSMTEAVGQQQRRQRNCCWMDCHRPHRTWHVARGRRSTRIRACGRS